MFLELGVMFSALSTSIFQDPIKSSGRGARLPILLQPTVLTAKNRDVGQGDFEYSEGQRGC